MSARQELTFSEPAQASYDQSFSDWAASVPWYRRFSARLGLQGKLMLCFMALLSAGLGTSCWMFASRSSTQMSEVMGEQARQLSCALALSSERAVTSNDVIELRRLAQDLIKSRNILYVGFLDEQSRSLVLASRDRAAGAFGRPP